MRKSVKDYMNLIDLMIMLTHMGLKTPKEMQVLLNVVLISVFDNN